MTKFIDSLSDIRKTLAFSALLHVLLFLLFLAFKVGIDFNTGEFAEVSFVSSSRGTRTTARARVADTAVKTPPEQGTVAPASKPTETVKSIPVNIPKRRMLEDEEAQLNRSEPGKLTPQLQASKVPIEEETYRPDVTERRGAAETVGDKISAGASNIPADSKETAPAGKIGTPGVSQPFTIEGDAARRTIITQVIPQYPRGLQREAVVKIRFTVLPDGTIGSMIPVQKGDPVLEEITMKALRKWRFNPLLPSSEQKKVEGIITFRYELK